ncbi:hypothetical protein [Streptomyces ipomoeae]|uniref:hypothetical protein n=1 Tax=Streptomyces ipomoeae TaxID=103232 RepID=UPI001147A4BB|nr:hypothetical protein [Streptomyces ipomoeae]MDX2937901.1 hypothetical protein [Streptomyces ipomoeae]TQE18284.1 hypothetical protein SipoB123_33325 [Streptomyces ipomoeae]
MATRDPRRRLTSALIPNAARGPPSLALCIRLGEYDVHQKVEANTLAAARALVGAGAVVEGITLPCVRDDLLSADAGHFSATFGAARDEIPEEYRDRLSPTTAAFEDLIRGFRARVSYLNALRVENRLRPPTRHRSGGVRRRAHIAIPGSHAGGDLAGEKVVVEGQDVADGLWAAPPIYRSTTQAPQCGRLRKRHRA